MHTFFHFLIEAMGLHLTFASPIFPLYIHYLWSLTYDCQVCSDAAVSQLQKQPREKKTTKKHILNSRYSFVLLCSYIRWRCIWWHLSVLRCDNQLILKDGYRLGTVAAYKLDLGDLSHQIPNISYQIQLNIKHTIIISRMIIWVTFSLPKRYLKHHFVDAYTWMSRCIIVLIRQ